MNLHKSTYELRQSQVHTPKPIVELFWSLLKERRQSFPRVLDLGAGDGRFAVPGTYKRYTGIEIDPNAARKAQLPKGAKIEVGCAFRHKGRGYNACIGNPPYVRHHSIESPWKEKTRERINSDLGFGLDLHGNLYLYFLCLALIKTNSKGLIGFVTPYEWVSRPSASKVRNYIKEKNWDVSIYRFTESIFDGVLTTACISIIDKSRKQNEWRFFDIDAQNRITHRRGISGSGKPILAHSSRGKVWAQRGLSPGSQEVFTLTEGERIHAGLHKSDVVPCVTSLKSFPKGLSNLDKSNFQEYFVDSGKRCWLIKSDRKQISARLRGYLDGIQIQKRSTYTCLNQTPWYAFEEAPTPVLLVHSGFIKRGPKVLINTIKAKAVGSVYGVRGEDKIDEGKLQQYLSEYDFESCVVSQSKVFKKIEVKQLNNVLASWKKEKRIRGSEKP
jgi:hypothetical protein